MREAYDGVSPEIVREYVSRMSAFALGDILPQK
jgi:hypothetical protein